MKIKIEMHCLETDNSIEIELLQIDINTVSQTNTDGLDSREVNRQWTDRHSHGYTRIDTDRQTDRHKDT